MKNAIQEIFLCKGEAKTTNPVDPHQVLSMSELQSSHYLVTLPSQLSSVSHIHTLSGPQVFLPASITRPPQEKMQTQERPMLEDAIPSPPIIPLQELEKAFPRLQLPQSLTPARQSNVALPYPIQRAWVDLLPLLYTSWPAKQRKEAETMLLRGDLGEFPTLAPAFWRVLL